MQAQQDIHISPPLNRESASILVSQAQTLWNHGAANQLILLFHKDCEWYSSNQTLTGRPAIFQYLQQQLKSRTRYSVEFELLSHSFHRLSIRYQSNWLANALQNIHCHTGNALIQLDRNGLISELTATGTYTPVIPDEHINGSRALTLGGHREK